MLQTRYCTLTSHPRSWCFKLLRSRFYSWWCYIHRFCIKTSSVRSLSCQLVSSIFNIWRCFIDIFCIYTFPFEAEVANTKAPSSTSEDAFSIDILYNPFLSEANFFDSLFPNSLHKDSLNQILYLNLSSTKLMFQIVKIQVLQLMKLYS